MNKRQIKKQFKKKYGVNPQKAIKVFNRIPDIMDNYKKVMKNWIEYICDFVNDLPQKVHDMPEEQFQRCINDPDISNGTKLLLCSYRIKG